jgi:hypothetical protein
MGFSWKGYQKDPQVRAAQKEFMAAARSGDEARHHRAGVRLNRLVGKHKAAATRRKATHSSSPFGNVMNMSKQRWI